MMHSKITLPENHKDYPHVWIGSCGKVRIILREHGSHMVVQIYASSNWLDASYHSDTSAWASILLRWGNAGGPFDELPVDAPSDVPEGLLEAVLSTVNDQDDY